MTPLQHMLWKKDGCMVVPLRRGKGHPLKRARRGDWSARHHSEMGLVGMDVVIDDIAAIDR